MTKDTGGSAFPIVEQRNSIGDITAYFEGGMTLRDYFAGQALQGLLSNPSADLFKSDNIPGFAEVSYAYADALIEASKS